MFESCLPLELGRHIVEVGNLTKKDFVVLSNVSRLFRNEAQRALFRDPGHFYLGVVKDSERNEAFFDAIISSPRRLALMVHTYSQDTRWYDDSWEEYGPSCDQDQEVIFEKMTQAFKLMDNMKRFQSSDSAFNGYFYDRMLKSVMQAFPKLEAFSWYYEGGAQQIIDFLAHQDRIRYLKLPSEFGLGDYDQQERERLLLVARTICPKLETISAPIETTKILLPGKSKIISSLDSTVTRQTQIRGRWAAHATR
ncbi:hypothetical protein D9619_006097 [Psilocybe cf. subviscida]|uniref:Uncharacterized protein n=1 Tax=Psilocybe cf. subviscida TaxID=2480587 RepID=A0A8H5EY56_9AGAR|nr:hypothetical protein D9619_006097 [Psilocybe cf. subviscida]